jgi:hypothetical protein
MLCTAFASDEIQTITAASFTQHGDRGLAHFGANAVTVDGHDVVGHVQAFNAPALNCPTSSGNNFCGSPALQAAANVPCSALAAA